ARKTAVYMWSQLAGTLPAPLFIFLTGVSFAIAAENMGRKGKEPSEIARKAFLRGAMIFGLGLLFRVQEFALGYPAAPWSDLFRVDVLNMLGLSMMFTSMLYWLTARTLPGKVMDQAGPISQGQTIGAALVMAALVALLTPPLWTTHRPSWLPWQL